IKSACPCLYSALRQYGVSDKMKLFSSGKLIMPDKIAIALAMGADMVNVARGFMISVGCIQTLKCHANVCPVGVATTDPDLQKALVIEEKKWRAANYVITLRKGLFRLAAAAGIDSPVHFNREHVIYKDREGRVTSLQDIYKGIIEEQG